MGIITAVPIDYRNYPGERLPHIGVFYIFPRFIDKGLCREFKVSISDYVHGGDEIISEVLDYEFTVLDKFLANADRNHFQAIRTEVAAGVSFRTLSNLIAQIHFQDFLKKHEWLRGVD